MIPHPFINSDLLFGITRTKDGTLRMRVDDSHEYADLKETYYTLSDGVVHSTVLSAQSSIGGWEGEDGDARPVDPDAYQIDGQACTHAAFDARRNELLGGEALGILCQFVYDMQPLDDFLSGKSDAYGGGALLKANQLLLADVTWLPDVIFTVAA